MVAVLGYTGGFESTYVPAIFPNMEEAKKWTEMNEPGDPELPWHFLTFGYGEVDFDYYYCDDCDGFPIEEEE